MSGDARTPRINLLREVRTKLQAYRPDTLARELLQNADDAGATSVSISYLPGDPGKEDWQGPLVCIWNDGDVPTSDFQKLSEISDSGKTGHPYKIGRFGVGKIALFAVSDAQVIRALGSDKNHEQWQEVIALPANEQDPNDLKKWSLKGDSLEIFKERLAKIDIVSGIKGLVIIFPPKSGDQSGQAWTKEWLTSGAETALPSWRTMAQVLPMMRSLLKLKVYGLGWKAEWTIGERDGDKPFRRSETLLGPVWEEPQSLNPWWKDPRFNESREAIPFSGNLTELIDGGEVSTFEYDGWEILLPHKELIGSQRNVLNDFSLPHAAVLYVSPISPAPKNASRASVPDKAQPLLRQVVFIGLGDMHEKVASPTGLVLHANGTTDPGRTHLIHLDPSEGVSFQGEFNRRLLRDGLLPLIPMVLGGKSAPDVENLFPRILDHTWLSWIPKHERPSYLERDVVIRKIWDSTTNAFVWRCIKSDLRALPLVVRPDMPTSWNKALTALTDTGLLVVSSEVGFSEPAKLNKWSPSEYGALEKARPENIQGVSTKELKEWYELIDACRTGSDLFDPNRDFCWLWSVDGTGKQGTWVTPNDFQGFIEQHGSEKAHANSIKAACPGIHWASIDAQKAFQLSAAGVTWKQLRDKLSTNLLWGNHGQRNILLKVLLLVPFEQDKDDWVAPLRQLALGGAPGKRFLVEEPGGRSVPDCLLDWVKEQESFALIHPSVMKDLTDNQRIRLNISTLSPSLALLAMKGASLESPTGKNRADWGKQVELEACKAYSLKDSGITADDWKNIPCHGKHFKSVWAPEWLVIRPKARNKDLLIKAATAFGITLIERTDDSIWDQFKDWSLIGATQQAWIRGSDLASALWGQISNSDAQSLVNDIPSTSNWLVNGYDNNNPLTEEGIKSGCTKVLQAKITSNHLRPEVEKDLTAWAQLPYHKIPGSDPQAWDTNWYRGGNDDDLIVAADLISARILTDNPFQIGDQNRGFWDRMPRWTASNAISACLDNGGQALEVVAPLLASLKNDIEPILVDKLATTPEWITAGTVDPFEIRARSARILALWFVQRGYLKDLVAQWKALPCFPLGGLDVGNWDNSTFRASHNNILNEAAPYLNLRVVTALTWPAEGWCQNHYIIGDTYWKDLALWTDHEAVSRSLQNGSNNAGSWLARWWDKAGQDKKQIELDSLIQRKETWIDKSPAAGESEARAAYRRAGEMLGLWPLVHTNKDELTFSQWRELYLHGSPGNLGPWPASRRITFTDPKSEVHKALVISADHLRLELLAECPENIPEGLRSHVTPILQSNTWSKEVALIALLGVPGGGRAIEALLHVMDDLTLNEDLKIQIMNYPWLRMENSWIAPANTLDSEYWPIWLPEPAGAWSRRDRINWPSNSATWFRNPSLDAIWIDNYRNLVSSVRAKAPEKYSLIPSSFNLPLGINQQQFGKFLETWLNGEPLSESRTTWDRAIQWATWLQNNKCTSLDLSKIQAQQGEEIPPNHWREGLKRLGSRLSVEGDLNGNSLAQVLALALAGAWKISAQVITVGQDFEGLFLPNMNGNWIDCNNIAASGHQLGAMQLSSEYHLALDPRDINGQVGRTRELVGEALLNYCQALSHTVGKPALASNLLGAFLVACGGHDRTARELLGQVDLNVEVLRGVKWKGLVFNNIPPVFIEQVGAVLSLTNQGLDQISADGWVINSIKERIILGSRNIIYQSDQIQTGICQILKHCRNENPLNTILNNFFSDIDHFEPQIQDDSYFSKRLENHLSEALLRLQRFLSGTPRSEVDGFLNLQRARLDELRQRLSLNNLGGQGTKTLNEEMHSQDLIFQERICAREGLHRPLMMASRSYIESLGYNEERVLLELFQNADDAASQWTDIGGSPWIQDNLTNQFHAICHVRNPTTTLRIVHWGRPIGMAGVGETRKPKWRDDLLHMIQFHGSGKSREAGDTGFFGLGFKSVYLLANEPFIFSGRGAWRVRGGLWPKTMKPIEGDYTSVCTDLGIQGDTLPTSENPYTIIAFRLNGIRHDEPNVPIPHNSERVDTLLRQFNRVQIPLLAFSRHIKRSTITQSDGHSQEIHWNPDQFENGLEYFRQYDHTWVLQASRAIRVLFKTNGNEIIVENDFPTFWSVAPTKVKWKAFGLLLNANFQLDTGRTEIQGSSSLNLNKYKLLAELAVHALKNWAEGSPSRWSSIWKTVGRPLSKHLQSTEKDQGAQIFARALSGLWWSSATLPVGSGDHRVAGNSVTRVLEGSEELWSDCPHSLLHAISQQFPGQGILPLSMWKDLLSLLPLESTIDPTKTRLSDLKFKCVGGELRPLYECCLPGDTDDWRMGWMDGHLLDLNSLNVVEENCSSNPVIRWLRRVRGESVEIQSKYELFRQKSKRQWFIQHPERAKDHDFKEDLYLLGALHQEAQARPKGDSLRKALGMSDFTSKSTPNPEEINSWIGAVHDAWANCGKKQVDLVEIYGSGIPESELRSLDEKIWRPAWFRLMAFCAVHSLGRWHPTAARNFIDWPDNVISLSCSDVNNTDSEGNKVWINWLYQRIKVLEGKDDQERDFTFRSLFAVLHRSSVFLPIYRDVLLANNQTVGRISAKRLMSPNSDERLEGSGLSAPSLKVVLGTVGFHVLIRELCRIGILTNVAFHPLAYPPIGGLRRKLSLHNEKPADSSTSRSIYNKLQPFEFGLYFDIPLRAAIDGKLSVKEHR